ncbi:sensor domain-containing protein [Mycobacterium sp. Y57]|uniref:sensor domain-containing protein n=1 Tax=Mycolicibacterium xanthum TaxID=2796469 RepID=UPI001C841E7F|nr:sensor domain-containing protein [Mycolicibacterium xanthum]MBX7433879.1 sensor domain-containing protein [Mycolicibacterium xanthum]
MRKAAGGLALLTVALAGCACAPAPETTDAPVVAASSLDGLLLDAAEVDAVMGARLTPLTPVTAMGDNRNLLPNLNCLGVWQTTEAAVYGERGTGNWLGVRRQTLREPDSDQWNSVAVQSVVLYESADTARDFFTRSAGRWAECTDHRVNITLNDKPLPRWRSGELAQTDTRLTMPITRGTGDDVRTCQHVLALAANVIIDVQACRFQNTPVDQAADIATAIEANVAAG